jgi:hypothetical protein
MSSRTLTQLILIVLSGVVVFSYIQPQFLAIQQKEVELDEYEQALEQATQFTGLLNSLINKANSLSQAELQALERYLPSTVDEVAVLQDLETIALRSGLIPTELSIGDDTEGGEGSVQFAQGEEGMEDDGSLSLRDRLTTHQFSGTFSGDYQAFQSFLQNVEGNAYPMRLVTLGIAPAEESNEVTLTTNYAYTLTVETYSYRATPPTE